MRQIRNRLLAAALTFILGLCAFALWSDFHRPQSPCASVPSSSERGRRPVTVRGMLYGSPDGKLTLNELECSGAWAVVEFEQSFRVNAEIREFIKRLNSLAGGDRMSRAEVVITGVWTLTDRATEVNEPAFVLSAIEIEQAAPISIISLVSN